MSDSNQCLNPECSKPAATGPGRTGKFCGSACAAKINNAKRRRIIHCKQCGKQIRAPKRYCDNSCQQTFRKQMIVDEWKNGDFNGTTEGGYLSHTIRQWLIEEADSRCPECGWGVPNPATGKVTLTVDHVDGDWLNNKRENLKVLCYNCHTLTPTFGALNKGNPLVETTRRMVGRGAP